VPEPAAEYVAPSPIPITVDAVPPREMTVSEIKACIQAFVRAAENAVRAGFDGVEIHGADIARTCY
jgi:NADPH2 dehydrogenase